MLDRPSVGLIWHRKAFLSEGRHHILRKYIPKLGVNLTKAQKSVVVPGTMKLLGAFVV